MLYSIVLLQGFGMQCALKNSSICLVLCTALLQGDVYVKRRSGQGVAVYETRCAELGLTPCSQVRGCMSCLGQLQGLQPGSCSCNPCVCIAA